MDYTLVRGLRVPKEHISVSQVRLFQDCAMKHFWKYRRGMKETKSFPLVRGMLLHEIAETDYAYKVETGGNLSLQTKESIYRKRLEEELLKEPVADVPTDLEADTQLVIAMLEHFDDAVSQKVHPVEVEKLVVYENPAIAYPVVLFIDLVALSPESGEKVIADSKFTSKAFFGNPSTDLQLGLYSIAEGTNNVEFHVGSVTSKPSASRIAGRVTEEYQESVIDVFSRVSKAIKAEAYTHRRPGFYPCTSKACSFWSVCQGKFHR